MKQDVQVERVYAAQTELADRHGYGRDMSIQEIRVLSHKIITSIWWKSRWPDVIDVRVTIGRGRTQAGASRDGAVGTLYFPERTRCELNVMHELAHVAEGMNEPYHSPEWARIYLEITKRWMPEFATPLSIAFQRHKVVVARTTRVIPTHDIKKVKPYQTVLSRIVKLKSELKEATAKLRRMKI